MKQLQGLFGESHNTFRRCVLELTTRSCFAIDFATLYVPVVPVILQVGHVRSAIDQILRALLRERRAPGRLPAKHGTGAGCTPFYMQVSPERTRGWPGRIRGPPLVDS